MKTYNVLSLLKYNGKDYADGTVDMTEAEAKQSVDLGVLELVGDVQVIELTAEERLEKVKAAIQGLNVDNGELWTAKGLPNSTALTAIVGFAVTAAERDAAWAEVKPAPETPPISNNPPADPLAPGAESAGDQTKTETGGAAE